MEAIGSVLGVVVPLNRRKAIITSQEFSEKSLASRSSCFFPRQNGFSFELHSGRESVLNKPKRMGLGLLCRSSALETVGSDLGEVRRKRLAVFVSGGGSNFQAIHKATINKLVPGDVVVLVTDKPDCGGAQYARDNGIPVVLFPKIKSLPEGLSATDLVNALRSFEVDFILLAGFLKLIPLELVQEYPKSILNIHPSLLPAFGGKGFYGSKVHQAVIASGARFSGPTVHFVDEHYDTGLILAQRVVPVLANDTPQQLAERVLHEEHRVYVEVVAAICEERIVWRDDGVPLIRSRENPDEYS